MKRISIVIMVILIAGVVYAFASNREKEVSGQVVDCETSRQPIAGVKVVARQRGWGFDGQLVWDKDFLSETTTDSQGKFSLTYTKGSSAHLFAQKEGFYVAEEWKSAGAGNIIKLLKAAPKTEGQTTDCNIINKVNIP